MISALKVNDGYLIDMQTTKAQIIKYWNRGCAKEQWVKYCPFLCAFHHKCHLRYILFMFSSFIQVVFVNIELPLYIHTRHKKSVVMFAKCADPDSLHIKMTWKGFMYNFIQLFQTSVGDSQNYQPLNVVYHLINYHSRPVWPRAIVHQVVHSNEGF